MNQWRNRSLGAFIAVSLFLAFTLEAQETNAEKAVFFLAEEQEAGGNWNREKRKQTVDTLESFLALQRVRGCYKIFRRRAARHGRSCPRLLQGVKGRGSIGKPRRYDSLHRFFLLCRLY